MRSWESARDSHRLEPMSLPSRQVLYGRFCKSAGGAGHGMRVTATSPEDARHAPRQAWSDARGSEGAAGAGSGLSAGRSARRFRKSSLEPGMIEAPAPQGVRTPDRLRRVRRSTHRPAHASCSSAPQPGLAHHTRHRSSPPSPGRHEHHAGRQSHRAPFAGGPQAHAHGHLTRPHFHGARSVRRLLSGKRNQGLSSPSR
jgi:hypothetical protein